MQDLGRGERTTGFELMDGVEASSASEICQEYSGTLRRNSMRECRDERLNMNLREGYFCQKAYAYVGKDERCPFNDCVLIYGIEGVGYPAGSMGCCSFIGEDLDKSFLDTLGPKFKKLADISMGKEIDSYPDPDPSWHPQSTELMCSQCTQTLASGHPPISPHFGTAKVISENIYPSGPGIPHPMPISDPLGYGNVTVREFYTTSGTLKPSIYFHKNQQSSNVVVTERVVGPISGADFHGMLEIAN